MIPKIIHYCWFGKKELPKSAQKCLASWKKYCPDYQIIRWDESSFDINSIKYTKDAYNNKKYAFVSDYIRIYALNKYGGIYLDTDVEIIKPLDSFLNNTVFFSFENLRKIQTGVIGSIKNSSLTTEILNYYSTAIFDPIHLITNVKIITDILISKGLKQNNTYQIIDKCTIYPMEYFCPINSYTQEMIITNNTHTIHWFSASWVSLPHKILSKIYHKSKKIIGINRAEKLRKFINKKRK